MKWLWLRQISSYEERKWTLGNYNVFDFLLNIDYGFVLYLW